MSENYFALSRKDRYELLKKASDDSRMPPAVLEKDIWVVWCLKILFNSAIAESLVFKGGTSLTEAFLGLIQRFSEDVQSCRSQGATGKVGRAKGGSDSRG